MKPHYLDWLIQEKPVTTSEGKQIIVYELVIQDDENILNAWAKHLRKHYCADSEIDVLRAGFGLERNEYLKTIKFPDERIRPGPSVRSGDFAEILVADYVQYVLDYIVPRTRYDRKVNRNSSTMGSDLIGYKCGKKISKNDQLIVFEVKAKASDVPPSSESILQKAVDDSNKDVVRLAETLNAVAQRSIDRHDIEGAKRVQRFQNSTDTPYRRTYGAAAVHSNMSYPETVLKTVSTLHHTDPDLDLLVIHCDKLMDFIHKMYGRACEC
ncbi:MAG: SAVED domain-containing protein [Paludibacter sp.]|nr:SAVED domain-containing protein [Paludibacter sp.]MDD4429070.1 SAVED domain-containing protein [Paludibacter sp.]